MSYLEEYEWMLLNEIAYNISFIYTFDEMKKEILIWIKSLVEFDGALITKVKKKSGGIQFSDITTYGIEPQTLEAWQKDASESNATSLLMMSGRNGSYIDNDSFSAQKWEQQPIYKNFYLPNHFYYSMGMPITFREEPIGMIKLYRGRNKGEFVKRDLFALDQLQKHFAYRFKYESQKGDSRYFYAKGYLEDICKQYHFTKRETEIFTQVIQGYSNRQIAEKENVSIYTIKKHLQNIYVKMGIKNRVQLLQCLPLSTDKINFDKL